MMRDFTLNKYDELCRRIIDSGYDVFTVNDYIRRYPGFNCIILRHDVDSRPGMALKMAELENGRGISSTYYFRFVKGIFDPEIIRRINDLGHEIGYHYEVLSKTGGNFEEAIKLFDFELAEFRKICSISTICMHGSVLSRFDNRGLWSRYDYRDFGISAEAYLSLGSNFCYLSDTGWEWNKKHKLRDIMPSKKDEPSISSTSELLDLMGRNEVGNIYLLVHPGNWTDKNYDWYYIFLKNKLFNAGKMLLRHANKYDN